MGKTNAGLFNQKLPVVIGATVSDKFDHRGKQRLVEMPGETGNTTHVNGSSAVVLADKEK